MNLDLINNLKNEEKLKEQNKVKPLYDNRRKQLRRDLDKINSTVNQKQNLLDSLRIEMEQIKSICDRELKFDHIMRE